MKPIKLFLVTVLSLFAVAATAAVNINTASKSELTTLNGVGDVLAQGIIDRREAEGDFETKAEVMQVDGIGEKTLESIRDDITVGGE